MRASILLVAFLVLAGCLGGTDTSPPSTTTRAAGRVNPLIATGAQIVDNDLNRTFHFAGSLGAGEYVPLAGAAPGSANRQHKVPVDGSVHSLHLHFDATSPAMAILRTNESRIACGSRPGRDCTTLVPNVEPAEWTLTVTSLAPEGTSYDVNITLTPIIPTLGVPPYDLGDFRVNLANHSGGEPTIAVLRDGHAMVVGGTDILMLDPETGAFTEVTPPVDASAPVSLDPFIYGDPVTDRVYVSQLGQCSRLSWTDDAGASWVTNPAACGGPEQHHQKLTTGPGPAGLGRVLHMGTMNLASWLFTDETVIFASRSFDGGAAWTQNPAMSRATHGMEPRAVGNIATTEDGTVHIIAYLCDQFVDAEYRGLAMGRSTDFGATWTWQRVGRGGGPCGGIDPGLATSGNNVYAVWWDMSDGAAKVWWAQSTDAGASWSDQQEIPTPGLKSFELVDAASSDKRLVASFVANVDSAKDPNQVDGWSRWYPFFVSLDLTQPNATWTVVRLEDDPVQRGPICIDGPKCVDGSRNLLDFIDIQLSREDRAYVAYPDGCNDACAYLWQSRRADLRVAVENP